ncbi:Hemoglobin-like flavoprotein [Reichenbachiella faecimaris]|uniref:Hemoglobin-like flavoprotein n=1 Tax=Reichenbachiella faecimaris TaxID=692418 RepID=A0A1W2G989_REIFA|nr:globin domain-containing protein [Reichenbachiella faecimaris]SMD32866.1 Hemoglobin-like flavoprotein [Reichenbachiella faecimaris]
MTTQEISTIKSCWEVIAPNGILVAQKFYKELFESKPEYRRLFTGDMDKQAEKLMMTLGFLMANLDRMSTIKKSVEDLGKLHANHFKVLPEYYPPVKVALISSIAYYMEEDWTQTHHNAWDKLINSVATMMINGANKKGFKWKFWK